MMLRIEMHTYWICGTGRGDGPGADELCAKTRDGLPLVPGKTLKGLLRDAAAIFANPADVTMLFGSDLASKQKDRVRALEAARFVSTAGVLQIDSAELGRDEQRDHWRAWARSPLGQMEIRHLYTRLASTRMDPETGTAADKTLRSIEVAVPMTLFAPLSFTGTAGVDTKRLGLVLAEAAQLVKELGSHRNRGLGRATLQLET